MKGYYQDETVVNVQCQECPGNKTTNVTDDVADSADKCGGYKNYSHVARSCYTVQLKGVRASSPKLSHCTEFSTDWTPVLLVFTW